MATEYTEGERLMNVETRLKVIEDTVLRMDTKLDAWSSTFVSKELLDANLRARDEKLHDLAVEIERIRNEKQAEVVTHRSSLPNWAVAIFTLIAAIAAVVGMVR